MIALVVRCWACSVFYPEVRVGPNFRVRVENHGSPVTGLRVQIGSFAGGNLFIAETDKNGFAMFRGVRPGSYHLSADHDAGIPDGANLEVKADGPTNATVPLRWPSIAPISVRSPKGTIRGPDYLPWQSQGNVSLDLLDGINGRMLRSLQTDERGEFNFGDAAPGLYSVRVKPSGLWGWSGEQIAGLIVVDVERDAPIDRLDLDLGWSSCGLYYAESSKCSQSDFHTARLAGQVVDSGGAAIARAKIFLIDPSGMLADELHSNGEGRFLSSSSLAGTYQLMVTSGGFTPYRRTVHLGPTGDTGGSSSLTVRLGLLGNCGATDSR